MGFGFNLFGFPLLLLATFGLAIYYLIFKRIVALKILGALWLSVIFLFSVVFVKERLTAPIKLSKANVTGNYRIDTNFFAGKNARWQYERYRFTITPTDSILFFVFNNGKPIATFRHKIQVSYRPEFWEVQYQPADKPHHVIKYAPTLYRSHSRFYYVLYSERYGNMFFRKIKD